MIHLGVNLDILPKQRDRLPVLPHQKRRSLPLQTSTRANNKVSPRKRLLSIGVTTINMAVIGLIGYSVYAYSNSNNPTYGVGHSVAQSVSNPLDTLSSAEIAVTIAKMTGLEEELAVTNQADTINLYIKAAIIEKEYVTKTQILSSKIKSKEDIVRHTVTSGDTVPGLATAYGVTSDSIRWSNGLTRDELVTGNTLFIPPVNGFVYVVGVGDTPEKLAETYSANALEITAFNDAELKGLTIGDQIVIPNGVKQRMPLLLKYRANYGNNGYWRGYCTWYVATKITVPNNWGNANTWDNFARLTPGWVVSTRPVVGAIAQSNSGAEGHVAIVEAVSDDGTMIKYSDMNGLAGWGVEGRTADWVPANRSFQNFIYRSQ
jgi:LysM repeat protein